ncbi:MAG TPA: hypothetical protein VK085_13800, partial [Pseudogracilibacillus sp.]|nr:hypothetical protein [Pseudogracilibacillus sp.]
MTFTLSGSSSILNSKYYPPINLDPNSDYVIGLINLETYNSFPNIDNSNNKFHFKSGDGKITSVEIPEGSYEIEDIENYILKEMIQLALKENKGRKRKLAYPLLM